MTKTINLSDIHTREIAPRCRIDKFPDVVLNKLDFVFRYAEENDISEIIQAGDVFDSWKASKRLMTFFARLLFKYKNKGVNFRCVAGQHDQQNHTQDLTPTPLGVLEATGALTILNGEPLEIDDLHIYGASWREDIPKIQDKTKINILATHRMEIKSKKIWEGQTDFSYAKSLLGGTRFNFILTGDNHSSFTEEHKGRHLVNCGSLLRTRIDQKDHKPFFVVYDSENNSYEKIYIPIDSFDLVSSADRIKTENDRNLKLQEYKEILKFDSGDAISYEENLGAYEEENEISEDILKFINISLDNDEHDMLRFVENILEGMIC